MHFFKTPKQENNPKNNIFAVYMEWDRNEHYVCDMVDSDTEEANAVNELGLTLRARLTRSRGKYAMLEGSIFNPERLLDAACGVTNYQKEEFTGGSYKRGYTLLTVTTDGCVNKYMIFSEALLKMLIKRLESCLGK